MTKKLRLFFKPKSIFALTSGIALSMLAINANAVPSFARQTGMACEVCHTVFPKLTRFGRLFKLNAYTLTGIKQVSANKTPEAAGLKINEIPPLSAMLQIAMTDVKKPEGNSPSTDFRYPQALSFYFAGEINPRMGSFIQVTMDDPGGGFGFDMADIRHTFIPTTLGGKSLTYGISANNGPGMADLWNGTPAWTFPYQSSKTAPTPTADPAINMMMMNSGIAGLSAYALYANHWYANLGFYRATGSTAAAGTIADNAPYWRLAWQGSLNGEDYLEVGAYGMVAKPRQGWMGMGAANLTDRYTDTAFDIQYERGTNDQLNLHAIYINEKQNLESTYAAGKSSNSQNTINQLRMDASYIQGGRLQYTLGYFNTTGSTDQLVYSDSLSGSPDSSGYIAEVDFLPWQNTKFTLQYTAYSQFDGGSSYNDSSSGLRNASDNNTLFLNSWFMW